MKARLRICVYLALALSLVVIGLPAFGASSPAATDGIEVQTGASQTCPFHKAPTPETQIDTVPAELLGHDCCGPDCRCACASLSMLVTQRFQSPLTLRPANLPHSANTLLALLHGNRLLRPPQA